MTVTRGTTNRNDRGSAADRRRRRAWLVKMYPSDIEGFARCYRCGTLLYDTAPQVGVGEAMMRELMHAQPLTVDRIIPGCRGGTYRRENIRPACGSCNSETGGATRKGK